MASLEGEYPEELKSEGRVAGRCVAEECRVLRVWNLKNCSPNSCKHSSRSSTANWLLAGWLGYIYPVLPGIISVATYAFVLSPPPQLKTTFMTPPPVPMQNTTTQHTTRPGNLTSCITKFSVFFHFHFSSS
jgi:hypothetical protein